MAISERALQFGQDRRLFGILTLPEKLDPDRPAILIPNTGLEHRVGPNRLHVHLCRAFADIGFAALRMDSSGFGDSELPRDFGKIDVVSDQQSALNELERLGIANRFVPIGLCSGGNDTHLLAKADPRVVAAAFLDHYSYPTWRYYLTFLAQRMADGRRIRNFVKRYAGKLSQNEKERFRDELVTYFIQPDQRQFAQDIQSFIQRRLPLFFLYTGESQNLYNYREQLLDACPPLRAYDLYDLHHFQEADHTFTSSAMRARLISQLKRWLLEQVLPQVHEGAGSGNERRA